MKYLITEKQSSFVVFIEAGNLKTICAVVDSIENTYSEYVLEVTYNLKAKQGSIIIKKNYSGFADKIKELLELYE